MRQNRAVVAPLFKKNAFAPSVSNKKRNNDVRTTKHTTAPTKKKMLSDQIYLDLSSMNIKTWGNPKQRKKKQFFSPTPSQLSTSKALEVGPQHIFSVTRKRGI